MTDAGARRVLMTPRFLDCNGRRLFALDVAPAQGAPHAAVLYLPPFAEEMNRCRVHAANTARQLAGLGWRCLLLDPFGTGESTGEIHEPTWAMWLADAQVAFTWLAGQSGQVPALWGMRTGALLASDLFSQLHAGAGPLPTRLLFWQPVHDGKLFLNQYLRLRLASQLVHEGARETTDIIRARLAKGQLVEIAGYPLSGALADGLAAQRMAAPQVLAQRPLDLLEILAQPGQEPSLPNRKLADAVRGAGGAVQISGVVAPFIWQSSDRADARQLAQATLRLLGLTP